ncbi:MAG: ThuA domain-containing protein [Clostridia bacterium]|nr:ThuA domain-containing protein [Clostridia bacterium]MBQ5820310.1 ThuA domain-containing protein [Clostridia bacterium]
MIRVLIWNEFHHERTRDNVRAIYPEGIHGCIRDFLKVNDDLEITTATLSEENIGLSDELLKNTDVLLWWGHVKHKAVPDEWVAKIVRRVQEGMGFIGLHSAHHSKVFCALMGTESHLRWRESGDHERLWNIAPNHPVMKGIPEYFELDNEETYGERFDIPAPHELLMIGWFSGGEVFRSVCTFNRGLGRILYIQPGHETVPTFHNPYIQKLITNGVYWAAPNCNVPLTCPHEPISPEERRKTGDQPTDYIR